MKVIDCDFLVVGSGSAGVMSAIHLAPHGKVIVLTKKNSRESNTNYAQGGVACVVDDEDSFQEHIQDTIDCGAGLCDPSVVDAIVRGGPERIDELETLGLAFWKRDGDASSYD